MKMMTRIMQREKLLRALFPGIGIALVMSCLLLSGCAARGPEPLSKTAALSDDAGIRVERIHPSAGGQMLDVRYRVTDKEKAKAALHRQARLYLVDQATGTRLDVPNMPKIGKLRQLPEGAESDRMYWMFFGNPGGLVKPGSRVTMVINEVRLENIVVQ
jgi:hypothetical protein